MKGRLLFLLLLLLALALGLSACTNPSPSPDGPGGVQGKTYKVSYYYDYDGDGIVSGEPDEIIEVAEDSHAILLSLAPNAEYEIEGWYLLNPDGTTGKKWGVSDLVTEDICLIANWAVREYTVHYYVGTFEGWAVSIPYGTVTVDPYAVYPEECEAIDGWKAQLDAGKVFLGWQTATGEPWDFDRDTVVQELSLYAVFGDPV